MGAKRSMFLEYQGGNYATQVPEPGNGPSGNEKLNRISLNSATRIHGLSVSKDAGFCIIAMPMSLKLDCFALSSVCMHG